MVNMRPLHEYMILFGAIIDLSVPPYTPNPDNLDGHPKCDNGQ
jgi:hypothetical protein